MYVLTLNVISLIGVCNKVFNFEKVDLVAYRQY